MFSSSKLRVLCLHGYTQNASTFKKRLASLAQTCGSEVELVFVDAPIVLRPADIGGSFCDASNQLAADPDPARPESAPRAWWLMGQNRGPTHPQFEGMDESIAYLRDILLRERFDGVFGFSQGAAMAAIITALLERPHLQPSFVVDGLPPHPPLKFCVSVAGYRPPCPLSDALFARPFETPALHVVGKTDITVIEEWSWTLLRVSGTPRLEEHTGGHFVPSKTSWRTFFKAWMDDPLGDVPGPGRVPVSRPASRAPSPTRGGNGDAVAVLQFEYSLLLKNSYFKALSQ